MTGMSLDLPLLFAMVLALGVALYVVMDGFDLGIGILFPFAPSDRDRDCMMNSIAPFWDGNETWLVLGGAIMIAAFPVAYATLLPAFYVPIVVMLFALIFRGIAFEFRFRSGPRYRHLWDWAFAGGSALAAFAQGLVLGGFIDGVPVRGGVFVGTTLGFLRPFAVVAGFGLVAGYALLGATWLIFKAEEPTGGFGRRAARPALYATLVFIGIVSLWTPFLYPVIAERWFKLPNILFLWPVPLVTALMAFVIWRTIPSRFAHMPFVASIALFLLAFLGLGISLFPYAVPRSITIWQAANPHATLAFVAVGVAIILPITLAYLAFSHWIFRGKARPDAGYDGGD
jgi:cytochrome d ubiquinol oxidase subunit II